MDPQQTSRYVAQEPKLSSYGSSGFTTENTIPPKPLLRCDSNMCCSLSQDYRHNLKTPAQHSCANTRGNTHPQQTRISPIPLEQFSFPGTTNLIFLKYAQGPQTVGTQYVEAVSTWKFWVPSKTTLCRPIFISFFMAVTGSTGYISLALPSAAPVTWIAEEREGAEDTNITARKLKPGKCTDFLQGVLTLHQATTPLKKKKINKSLTRSDCLALVCTAVTDLIHLLS